MLIAVTEPTKSVQFRQQTPLRRDLLRALDKQGGAGGYLGFVRLGLPRKGRANAFTGGNGANGSLRAIFDGKQLGTQAWGSVESKKRIQPRFNTIIAGDGVPVNSVGRIITDLVERGVSAQACAVVWPAW
jgi:hypothetical protein